MTTLLPPSEQTLRLRRFRPAGAATAARPPRSVPAATRHRIGAALALLVVAAWMHLLVLGGSPGPLAAPTLRGPDGRPDLGTRTTVRRPGLLPPRCSRSPTRCPRASRCGSRDSNRSPRMSNNVKVDPGARRCPTTSSTRALTFRSWCRRSTSVPTCSAAPTPWASKWSASTASRPPSVPDSRSAPARRCEVYGVTPASWESTTNAALTNQELPESGSFSKRYFDDGDWVPAVTSTSTTGHGHGHRPSGRLHPAGRCPGPDGIVRSPEPGRLDLRQLSRRLHRRLSCGWPPRAATPSPSTGGRLPPGCAGTTPGVLPLSMYDLCPVASPGRHLLTVSVGASAATRGLPRRLHPLGQPGGDLCHRAGLALAIGAAPSAP